MADIKQHIRGATAARSERLQRYLAKSLIVAADGERERRLAEQECQVCWYLDSRVAGQAFVNWECQDCGKQGSWPNTAHPRICKACASKHDLCRMCGADIDLRNWRRGIRPPRGMHITKVGKGRSK